MPIGEYWCPEHECYPVYCELLKHKWESDDDYQIRMGNPFVLHPECPFCACREYEIPQPNWRV